MSARPSKPTRNEPASTNRHPPRPASSAPEIVDPRWIAKAVAIVIAACILLAYFSICFLIYQGGWQLMLHPAPKGDPPASLPAQIVHFDAAETGTPRLVAWWLPAEEGTTNHLTVLYLHSGSGSLPASADLLAALHQAGVNIFAIDYRGFGLSSGPHPTEKRMTEDSDAALLYLTDTRHIPAAQIVPYGEGLGAALAAKLAVTHPEIPAVILDSPDPLAFDRATSGGSMFLPTRILVQERFDLGAVLPLVKQPKLLLHDEVPPDQRARFNATSTVFKTASHPKMTVTFGTARSPSDFDAAVRRFLDEYLRPS
jgi:pimeloyl-ACP methyl ester carboxylesterase